MMRHSKADIVDYLACQSTDSIVAACNDIYDYRYNTGILAEKSIVRYFAERLDEEDIRFLCDVIEDYAAEHLRKVISLCMQIHPEKFFKTVK